MGGSSQARFVRVLFGGYRRASSVWRLAVSCQTGHQTSAITGQSRTRHGYVLLELAYYGPDQQRGFIKLKAIDSAQGQALVSTRKLTTLQPKK